MYSHDYGPTQTKTSRHNHTNRSVQLKTQGVSGIVSGTSELSSLEVLRVYGQKYSQSVLQHGSNRGSDHRINKLSIDSLDISITLTIYKLAHSLSGMDFCLHDRIQFEMQPRYMVCTNTLLRRTFKQWN